MAEQDTFFTPDHVDEQIEQSAHEQETARARLLNDLQRTYQAEAQEDAQSLVRVWQRIAGSHRLTESAQQKERLHTMAQPSYPSTRSNVLLRPEKFRNARTLVGTIAAVVLLTLLVGSIVLVLHQAHQNKVGSHSPTPTIATSSLPVGTTIYSHQQDAGSATVAWSPDGKRIASVVNPVDSAGAFHINVQIWDATTGQHRVTYTPDATFRWIYQVLWSPDSKRIAIVGTNVQIWDAATGKVLLTMPGPPLPQGFRPTIPPATTRSSSNLLGSFLPTQRQSGGSSTIMSAWSPDGVYIASLIPLTSPSNPDSIKIWNSSTGVVHKIIAHPNCANIALLTWSPDGKYLASPCFVNKVDVWDVTTGETVQVFTSDMSSGYARQVVWSPNSQYIAFINDNNVEIWEAITGKHHATLKSNTTLVQSPLAWSPNGQWIAVAESNDVQLWSATTHELLYTYKATVSSLVWSPDSSMIVSVITPTVADGLYRPGEKWSVRVWTADPTTSPSLTPVPGRPTPTPSLVRPKPTLIVPTN